MKLSVRIILAMVATVWALWLVAVNHIEMVSQSDRNVALLDGCYSEIIFQCNLYARCPRGIPEKCQKGTNFPPLIYSSWTKDQKDVFAIGIRVNSNEMRNNRKRASVYNGYYVLGNDSCDNDDCISDYLRMLGISSSFK